MGHQHRNDGNDENDLKNGFCRSNEQLQFNLDRIIQKYENMELSGKCSGVEIDLDGYVYYPEDMPKSRLDRILQKLINRNENFGLSAFAAQDNGPEIFGKQFKQRLKECRKLDAEFDQRFKSRHPGWRPYTTPRKSRVERTVIRKTVKELTFENPMDYLNYLMKVKHIPEDVFRQQEIGYVNRMALPSTELEISQESPRPGRGARTIRSRSTSPCMSTERRIASVTGKKVHNFLQKIASQISSTDSESAFRGAPYGIHLISNSHDHQVSFPSPSSLMVIGDSCIRSRECSPVSSHPPYDDFPTTSQVKGPAPLMFVSDSCNRSRDCSPSTSRLSDNDDYFASAVYQSSRPSSECALDQNRAKIMNQFSESNLEAENSFPSTNRRFGKDSIPAVWQEKESSTVKSEERKLMSPAEEKLKHGQQDSTVAKKEKKYAPDSNENARTSSTSARKMDSKSQSTSKNDVDASKSVIVNAVPFPNGNWQSSEVPNSNSSLVTPSLKKMPALTAVGSADSKASNSGKKSRKRKSSKTPTASKTRRSKSQTKSPEVSIASSAEKTSPPKEANPQATPKTVLSIKSSISSKNSRKRKSSQTPGTASKSRLSNSQKKSIEGSKGSSTEAVVSSKRAKTQATPKTVMSADSSANNRKSRRRDLSQTQLTPASSRLRTHRAQYQSISPASTPLTTKKKTCASKSQTPQAAATITSPNSFETPNIDGSQMSVRSGSKSKKRSSKTPKTVETQPSAKRSSKRSKKEEKASKICSVTSASNANILLEKEIFSLTKCSPENPLHGNIDGSKNKELVPKSTNVAAKAQRKLRSRRKTFTPGTVQKLSKKSKRMETTLKKKNVRGKRKSSSRKCVVLENDTIETSNKAGNAENTATSLQSALVHKNSPVSFNSQKLSASKKPGKRRSVDSDFERVVTPLGDGEPIAFDFWNGNVSSVVESYDNNFMSFGKPTTILGFDAGDVRRSCGENAQQSTLSAFLNCAWKYSLSEAESASVDEAMKEDRRAMAAARNRNRQLISGYYV